MRVPTLWLGIAATVTFNKPGTYVYMCTELCSRTRS